MGNICSWCLKNQDESHSNGNIDDYRGVTNSQRSLSTSEVDDRTPLLRKQSADNHHPVTSVIPQSQSNGESLSFAPLPPPLPTMNESRTDSSTNVSTNETAETKMAFIVEGMLSKLIDVGNGASSGIHSSNCTTNGLNSQNDHLRQILNKSFSSTKISSLPDAGLNNLPSLLSGRPVSSDICHFVAHTAGELSHLLLEEIKIVHKEELVVIFE